MYTVPANSTRSTPSQACSTKRATIFFSRKNGGVSFDSSLSTMRHNSGTLLELHSASSRVHASTTAQFCFTNRCVWSNSLMPKPLARRAIRFKMVPISAISRGSVGDSLRAAISTSIMQNNSTVRHRSKTHSDFWSYSSAVFTAFSAIVRTPWWKSSLARLY